ncbi:enolase 4 isoform X3 [Phyllopteryx taeniolatus]|uniref:enolase 4 isoform X3 n=1 Tax=Phyllopteryx taeniolatus TaxID=161469 RepID=UPI002AD34898|nr:enolase 4 isoform X3 [Phyllopteryx taeniolatus]
MSRSVSCLSEEDQEFDEIKNAAAAFYRANRVPEELERALGELFFQNPEDVHGYLANYFTKLSSQPLISRLNGKEVYDSRGQLCAEAEVFCMICNKEKRMSSAAISSHLGQKDPFLDWQAKSEERVYHVKTAVHWIVEPLNKMLKEQNPCDQSDVDQKLSNFFMARHQEEKEIKEKEESHSTSEQEVEVPSSPPEKKKEKKTDKKKKGSSEKPFCPAEPPEPLLPGCLAIGSVSLAVAKSGAQIKGMPLYKYIRALKNPEDQARFHIPVSLVTLLSCGKTSPGKLNLLEEVILIPNAGQQVKQVLNSPTTPLIITMTTQLQKEMMRIMSTSSKAGVTQAILSDSGVLPVNFDRPEQALDLITEACNNLALELGTEIHLAMNCAGPDLMDYDREQWEKLSSVIGQSCVLLSDKTNKPQAPPLPGVTGHILKHINEITVSDLISVTSELQGSVLLGTTSNESCDDDSLSDIAVGLGLDYVKLGGLASAERMTKYNRLVSIEEELAQQGILVSKEQHSPPLFTETEEEVV